MPSAIASPEAVNGSGSNGAEDDGAYDVPLEKFTLVKQEVDITVDFWEKSIRGVSEITVVPLDELSVISVDSRQCEIDLDGVTVDGQRARATYDDPYELMDIPPEYKWTARQHHYLKHRMRRLFPALQRRRDLPVTDPENKDIAGCQLADASLRIVIPRETPRRQQSQPAPGTRRPPIKIRMSTHGSDLAKAASVTTPAPQDEEDEEPGVTVPMKPVVLKIPFRIRNVRDGLHFVGVDDMDRRYPHLYTRHSLEPGSASCIFPCLDDRTQRAVWKVVLRFPKTVGDALHQQLKSQQKAVAAAGGGGAPTNGSGSTSGVDSGALVAASGGGSGGPGDERGGRLPLAKQSQQHLMRSRDLALTEEDKLLEMTAICSGQLIDEVTDESDETLKVMSFEANRTIEARTIGFAIGPFEHIDLTQFRTEEDDEKLGANATKIHAYCLPKRGPQVQWTCEALVAAADFFSITFSKYPFDSFKLCFVEDMVEDTVPLWSFALCSTRLLYGEEIIDREHEVTRKLVHTLASQWSGMHIVPNQQSDMWVVVGMAYFMTDLFMKRLAGNNEYRFRQKTMADRLMDMDRGRPSLHDLGKHLTLGSFEMEFMQLKAPLVLFILDRRLTKSSGMAGITRVMSKLFSKATTSDDPKDETVSTESFRKACEKVSQLKLEPFWNQWVFGTGCPRFDVVQRFNKKRLCVEVTIKQVQERIESEVQPLTKDDFWRHVIEDQYGVSSNNSDVRQLFTGPMTIRIHEADGTPYEHIIEIREDAARVAKFDIPYNTKYKRLKRTKRQKERASTNVGEITAENQDDVLLYCLGDVLQSQDDMTAWGLVDWDAEMERQMEQESYEWIRMDADFEWVCTIKTNLPPYMYVSQLQQDRDVVAQQESMLFLQGANAHPLVSTILIRTVMDKRYFHGLRSMAAAALPKHAVRRLNFLGFHHLQKAFATFFCYPGTITPQPNDFSDRRQYAMQCCIPLAIARVRDDRGKCLKEARRFLLDLLRFNNNSENEYSDNFYVAKLLEALTTSLIPTKKADEEVMNLSFDNEDEEAVDAEEQQFLNEALDEIERYGRMDEWSSSYQNIFTITSLDCKQRLMKAGVIPTNFLDFVKYLQDETLDLVRLKAFEALVDLGAMLYYPILRLIVVTLASDRSPFVRDRLFQIVVKGVAAIALGEQKTKEKEVILPKPGDLILEQDSSEMMEAKKAEADRKKDMHVALAALKKQIKEMGDGSLQTCLWDAIRSPVIGLQEKRNLIHLCAALFDEDEPFPVTLKYPRAWKAVRGPKEKGRLWIRFTSSIRTTPKSLRPAKEPTPASIVVQPQVPAPAPAPLQRKITIPARTPVSINLNGAKPSAPAPAVPAPSHAHAPISAHPQPTPAPPPPPAPPRVVTTLPGLRPGPPPPPHSETISVMSAAPQRTPFVDHAPSPFHAGSAVVAAQSAVAVKANGQKPPSAAVAATPPSSSLKRARPVTAKDKSPRPSKIVKLRVRPEKLRRFAPGGKLTSSGSTPSRDDATVVVRAPLISQPSAASVTTSAAASSLAHGTANGGGATPTPQKARKPLPSSAQTPAAARQSGPLHLPSTSATAPVASTSSSPAAAAAVVDPYAVPPDVPAVPEVPAAPKPFKIIIKKPPTATS